LFESADVIELEPQPQRLQRCLKRDVVFGTGSGDWREFQANQGMAALLMPRPIFVTAFQQELERFGCHRADRGSSTSLAITASLAGRFKVSKQAAQIRLHSLQLLTHQDQAGFFD
jgi:Zn-dependent peptidase ImmA (M78 family)